MHKGLPLDAMIWQDPARPSLELQEQLGCNPVSQDVPRAQVLKKRSIYINLPVQCTSMQAQFPQFFAAHQLQAYLKTLCISLHHLGTPGIPVVLSTCALRSRTVVPISRIVSSKRRRPAGLHAGASPRLQPFKRQC